MTLRYFSRLSGWLVPLALASNALAGTPPTILVQPQSQSVALGLNVTFSVSISESGQLPSVSSGALRLWLKADTGVVTNSAGQVSHWRDQSGNGLDAYQSAAAQQPALTNASLPAGTVPAVRFNGIQDPNLGDYLQGTNDVRLSNAYTSFVVYSLFNSNPTEKALAVLGEPALASAARACYINHDSMGFSAWNNDYTSPFQIPVFTYRIWTDRLNAPTNNAWLVELFDNDGTNSSYFSDRLSGLQPPTPGYSIGGLGSETRNFQGDVCEAIYYSGSLTESDRMAVQSYLQAKYFLGTSNPPVVYQWRFDGSNIAGANSSSLTITNVQSASLGSYSVLASNSFGSVNSSNAVLTTFSSPGIIAAFANAGFEAPKIATNTTKDLSAGSTFLTGWTVGGTGGPVEVVNGILAGYAPDEGQQWLSFNSGNTAAGSSISQTFLTTGGQSYGISFALGSMGSGNVSMKVTVVGPSR